MTEKLVQEITHHIEAYNLFPTKIRFVVLVFISSVADDLTPCPSEALRDNEWTALIYYVALQGYIKRISRA